MVVSPKDLAQNTFLGKAQPFGNGPTGKVAGSATDFHPVQAQLPKGIFNHLPGSSRHNTVSGVWLAQPVDQFGLSGGPVPVFVADGPGQFAFVPDTNLEAVVFRKPFQARFNKILGFLNGFLIAQNGHPFPEVFAALNGQVKQWLGVPLFEQAQRYLIINF